ncbi:MAG: tetratricopeptide repeat protein, partial [Terrimicrobiaceae bacterium]
AAYTKKKDYVEAKRNFEKALELAPGMFAAHFNMGEVEFLQGNYDEALAKFQVMLDADPRNELLQFKVFMCYLLRGDERAAKRSLSRIKYPGDTPAWYYAQAAWEHKQGNKAKTSEYLSGARYIFSGKTDIFDETFTDLDFPRR